MYMLLHHVTMCESSLQVLCVATSLARALSQLAAYMAAIVGSTDILRKTLPMCKLHGYSDK